MNPTERLHAAIDRLLRCPALNVDDLEDEDRAAIADARALLAATDTPAAGATRSTDIPPPTAAQPGLPIRCPECGERDVAKFQMLLPAWFRVTVEHDADGTPCFQPGDLVDTDVEADARVYCETCGEVRDEDEFVDVEGDST